GEGRAVFASGIDQSAVDVGLRYVTGDGLIAQTYPANPNGSPGGIAGVTSRDGRATILMPHPERTLRSANFSWAPADWPDESPWLRMFRNARTWLG
ncbi:MAG: phosphoribosylformylglycinamidine synthase subunit PurQ, partial [Pseudomonadota bacterium]|nr:phosphoribosylformylglycinamidine synthase subunit PurQ [Pseudomonadota bacterium]